MYNVTKLPKFIKAILLFTGLLATIVAMAAAPNFDANCVRCHGDGNTGANLDGVIIPPVRDGSFAGIKNSITPVPIPGPGEGHTLLKTLYDFGGGISDQTFVDIAAELATLTSSPCTQPQTLVNGVCTTPTTTPIPAACDDIANRALCVNQLHQYGSLGSTATSVVKTDVYKVTCAKQAVAVSASVMGLTAENPAKLSVQVTKGSSVSRISTDKVNGDGIASKLTRLVKGSGAYTVKVIKEKSNLPGIVQYDAQISCLDKKKVQIDANVFIRKNQ
jgi:hypothetical protein